MFRMLNPHLRIHPIPKSHHSFPRPWLASTLLLRTFDASSPQVAPGVVEAMPAMPTCDPVSTMNPESRKQTQVRSYATGGWERLADASKAAGERAVDLVEVDQANAVTKSQGQTRLSQPAWIWPK